MNAFRPIAFGLASLFTILLVGADPAEAGKGAGKGKVAGLKKLDTNGDGKISRDEFNAAGKGKGGKLFDKLDTNGDGFLTKDELAKARASKKKAN